jgi:fatty acid desaturase
VIVMRDYSLVGESARQAVERGLATGNWYRTPVPRARMKQLMQRRNGPAIRDTIVWIALLIVSGGAAAWLFPSWWSVPCFLVYGVLYGSASDSRWHECGHGTAFRTRWMNDVVYQLACFMIMRNPTQWRWSHARHHTDTIIVGRDPEIITMRPPKILPVLLNFVGLVDVPLYYRALARHVLGRLSPAEADYIPQTEHRRVVRVARIHGLVHVVIVVWALAAGSILPVLLFGPLPRLYGGWHVMMTGLIQHTGMADNVLDHRLNTRTCYMNPLTRFVYWNMNYHIEHHMYPMVPFHALPALHDEIKHDLPTPTAGIVPAFREMVPVLLGQRRDPELTVAVVLPRASASA